MSTPLNLCLAWLKQKQGSVKKRWIWLRGRKGGLTPKELRDENDCRKRNGPAHRHLREGTDGGRDLALVLGLSTIFRATADGCQNRAAEGKFGEYEEKKERKKGGEGGESSRRPRCVPPHYATFGGLTR